MLTQAIEDYLKVIFKLTRERAGVTTNAVAARMGVAPASVSNMVKKLARLKLVEHMPYHGMVLTPRGVKVALEVIRHHRLLELYLSQQLGVRLDRVDEEAERLEHVLSEEVEEKIAGLLGQPTLDPHGDPIPTREGAVDEAQHPRLADLGPGEEGAVVRVSDRHPAVLRALARQGLLPGTRVRVTHIAADGVVYIQIGPRSRPVRPDLAAAVYIEPDRAPGRAIS